MLEFSEGQSYCHPRGTTETHPEVRGVENAALPNTGATEEDLVAAAKNGDTHAFGELVERHRNECMKRAMLMIRNRNDAEDEVQNAFWLPLEEATAKLSYKGEREVAQRALAYLKTHPELGGHAANPAH